MINLHEIENLEGPHLQIYTKLSESQLYHCREPERGLFIAESPKVIDRALDAGYRPVSMLVDSKELNNREAAHILLRRAFSER